jgi:kynurenine 3-monooxygenase
MEPIIIVGAGLVGTVLSLFLKKRGFNVTIYERSPDLRECVNSRRPSVNLTLCERGLRSLEPVGVREIVARLSEPAYGRYIHHRNGELSFHPYGLEGEALYSINRNELNAALLDEAERRGVRIVFSTRCLDINLDAKEIQLEDAAHRSWKETPLCVFAADGCFSTVRSRLQRRERFNYSQDYSKQGYCELQIPAKAPGLSYWPRNGLHLWPRTQYYLISFPNQDGSFTGSLHMPFEGQASFNSISTERALLKFFETDFPDLLPMIPNLAEQFFKQRPNTMLTIRCSPWGVEDKVLLVGDSAHAILPSYGQGANIGFEDCAILDEIIGRYAPDWKRVFRTFEQLRKPETEIIADLCYEHVVVLQDLLVNPSAQLRLRVEQMLHRTFPDLYQPLYSMISFSSMPFSEALKKHKQQQRIVENLIRRPEILDRFEKGDDPHRLEKIIFEN